MRLGNTDACGKRWGVDGGGILGIKGHKLRWEKFRSNSGASAAYPAEVMAWFSVGVQHDE